MLKFRYIGKTRDGLEVRGVLDADARADAIAQLKIHDYRRVRVSRATGEYGGFLRRLFRAA